MNLEQIKVIKVVAGEVREFTLPEAIQVYASYIYECAVNERPYESFDTWLST